MLVRKGWRSFVAESAKPEGAVDLGSTRQYRALSYRSGRRSRVVGCRGPDRDQAFVHVAEAGRRYTEWLDVLQLAT